MHNLQRIFVQQMQETIEKNPTTRRDETIYRKEIFSNV